MMRKHLIPRRIGASGTFRLRGEHVSRLEAFSDAVFAFAVTLLVVTLQPPQSYNDLLKVVHGLGAFALSFIMLIFVWFNHYRFFRRYGLEDQPTALLNAILLFVVLFYVYPLRFLFTVVVAAFTAPDETNHLIHADQLPGLYIMYGAGVMAVFLLFALLNLHAFRQRTALELTPHEVFETQSSMYANLVVVAIALISVISALAGFGFAIRRRGMDLCGHCPRDIRAGAHQARSVDPTGSADERGAERTAGCSGIERLSRHAACTLDHTLLCEVRDGGGVQAEQIAIDGLVVGAEHAAGMADSAGSRGEAW